ncbi:type II secretion system protein GspH [Acinetobacter cumulans]|uniref:Type II secretion system protein GspH n=1 Tax=Acinetobacter cumulans TaxID=2136182 RepID=A0A3A8GGY1_9GAMM|nr:prepilin-type N-terminal cleavage/methylation domain-containing protein [Acinetobacter cumulans]RKG54700.1 type II secretion system protein GspH [Acinetobacter cumulans]
MYKSKGFTLIELMVVIAVMAIIAMMAAPSFNALLLKQNMNKSARALASTLSEARAKAALERRQVTVVLNSSAENTPSQLNWAPSGQAILKTTTPTQVVFKTTGLVDTTNEIPFVVCNKTGGNLSKTITITKMGTVQIVADGSCT